MKKQTLLTIGLATLLASATHASQEQLARSIGDAHLEATRTSEQLKAKRSEESRVGHECRSRGEAEY